MTARLVVVDPGAGAFGFSGVITASDVDDGWSVCLDGLGWSEWVFVRVASVDSFSTLALSLSLSLSSASSWTRQASASST